MLIRSRYRQYPYLQ